MGLANSSVNEKIVVDYDKPVEDLYEEASRYLVFEEMNLSLLSNQTVNITRNSTDAGSKAYHELTLSWSVNVVRKGDVIVVLSGGDVPSVLRPMQDSYILIGECYVEGIMYGELIKAQMETHPGGEKQGVKGEVFHIR
ncbi:uncharacterized protein GLRG_11377 [Colletotrichum graminicola M1.001]|uniref:Heterokaryon incompatibility protein n=1 Tax=Colletotrichum graminicola (strain M1.001 / M2 / FGSC 10212) TaxID=645133 RepID=E3QZE4_COLGM|nr:uncharacterized protein GLRG_11377 [Colletotrichum graminicola M1.001]EFQ36232.1 hypothetical protein GLRG_11377 [Colletotrichum graminicola M1.001]